MDNLVYDDGSDTFTATVTVSNTGDMDGKATVQLSGGNASVGGSKTQVYGDTTINAKTEVKGELKAPTGTFDNVKAGTSFKSPNISDGMGAGGAGGGGSLSAKLKVEDAK